MEGSCGPVVVESDSNEGWGGGVGSGKKNNSLDI